MFSQTMSPLSSMGNVRSTIRSMMALGVITLSLTACHQANQTTSDKSAATTASGDNATSSQNVNGKKITIATEGQYKPFNFTNPDGSLGGYDVDVAKAVCAKIQANCNIVAKEWDGILPGLMAKKYDAIFSGMSVTPERSAQVDFTTPYFKNTMVWVAGKGTKFNPQAPAGSKLGGQRSTTLAQYLQDKLSKNNEVKLYDNYDNAYIDLKSGRIDAILSEKVTATEWLKTNGDKFAIVGGEIDNNDNIAAAVRKGDPLKVDFDKALATLQSSGELAKLQKQYFGQ